MSNQVEVQGLCAIKKHIGETHRVLPVVPERLEYSVQRGGLELGVALLGAHRRWVEVVGS